MNNLWQCWQHGSSKKDFLLLKKSGIKVPMQQDAMSILQINYSFFHMAKQTKQKDGSLLREESGGTGGKFYVIVAFINFEAVIIFGALTATPSCRYSLSLWLRDPMKHEVRAYNITKPCGHFHLNEGVASKDIWERNVEVNISKKVLKQSSKDPQGSSNVFCLTCGRAGTLSPLWWGNNTQKNGSL